MIEARGDDPEAQAFGRAGRGVGPQRPSLPGSGPCTCRSSPETAHGRRLHDHGVGEACQRERPQRRAGHLLPAGESTRTSVDRPRSRPGSRRPPGRRRLPAARPSSPRAPGAAPPRAAPRAPRASAPSPRARRASRGRAGAQPARSGRLPPAPSRTRPRGSALRAIRGAGCPR